MKPESALWFLVSCLPQANYRRAADIDCTNLGEGHPDCAIHWNNLGSVFQAQGRLGEAEAMYLRALRITEAAVGAEHTDSAVFMNNLALLYKLQARREPLITVLRTCPVDLTLA